MAEDYGLKIWQSDRDAAQAEAVRRIHDAAETGATRLDLRDLSAMTAIPEEIEMLPNLQALWCGYENFRADLMPIYGKRALRDIDALGKIEGLTHLGLASCSIKDLGSLYQHEELKLLNLADTRIDDIDSVGALTSLESLNLGDIELQSLRFLSGLTYLESLQAGSSGGKNFFFDDPGVLSNLQLLRSLRFPNVNLPSYGFLSDLGGLETVFLSGSNFSNASYLERLRNMTVLDIDRCKIDDLSQLAGLSQLHRLSFDETEVLDIAFLLKLEQFFQEAGSFLSFFETPASNRSNDRRLHMLSLLDPERCAVETIQYLKGTHPDFRDPPKSSATKPTTNTLAHSGDVGLSVTDGKLTATNAGQPEKAAPQQLALRIDALRIHLEMLQNMATNTQCPPDVLNLFAIYAKALNTEPPTYVMLDGPMSFLRGGVCDTYITEALDGAIIGGWQQLVQMHDELREYLLPPVEDDLPEPSEEATPEAGIEITDDVLDALDDPSVDRSVIDALTAMKDYFVAAKQDLEGRPGLLKKGFLAVAGVVGTIVTEVSTGVIGTWAASPQGQVILQKLQPIWDMIKGLFGV